MKFYRVIIKMMIVISIICAFVTTVLMIMFGLSERIEWVYCLLSTIPQFFGLCALFILDILFTRTEYLLKRNSSQNSELLKVNYIKSNEIKDNDF